MDKYSVTTVYKAAPRDHTRRFTRHTVTGETCRLPKEVWSRQETLAKRLVVRRRPQYGHDVHWAAQMSFTRSMPHAPPSDSHHTPVESIAGALRLRPAKMRSAQTLNATRRVKLSRGPVLNC